MKYISVDSTYLRLFASGHFSLISTVSGRAGRAIGLHIQHTQIMCLSLTCLCDNNDFTFPGTPGIIQPFVRSRSHTCHADINRVLGREMHMSTVSGTPAPSTKYASKRIHSLSEFTSTHTHSHVITSQIIQSAEFVYVYTYVPRPIIVEAR